MTETSILIQSQIKEYNKWLSTIKIIMDMFVRDYDVILNSDSFYKYYFKNI